MLHAVPGRADTLRLSGHDLIAMADAIRKLEATDLTVREIEVASYILTLDRDVDQRDGTTYFITHIRSRKPTSTSTAFRES
jgi:hypothetical protein